MRYQGLHKMRLEATGWSPVLLRNTGVSGPVCVLGNGAQSSA